MSLLSATLSLALTGPLLYTGLALAACVLLGGYVGLIAAVVKAAGLQQKNHGWIGIGFGVTLLVGWSVLLVAVLVGVGLYARRNAPAKAGKVYCSTASTLRGMHKFFTITAPGGWSSYPYPPENADVRIGRDGLYLEVFSRWSTGTSIEAVERWQNRLKETSERCELGSLSSVQIDGAVFLKYPAQTRRKGSSDDYERVYYVYAGPQGTYEMVGWRRKAWHPGDEDTLNGIAASFRFPPVSAAKAPVPGRHAPTPIPWPAISPSASPRG